MGVSLHSKPDIRSPKRAYLLFPHENLIFSITNIIFDFDKRFGKVLIFQGFADFLMSKNHLKSPLKPIKPLIYKTFIEVELKFSFLIKIISNKPSILTISKS